MRALLLASATLLLTGGMALAQNSNSPLSNNASNTGAGRSTGTVAPRLPVPAQDASIDQYLNHAESALRRNRTGEAQEALERAETRALSRSTEASQAGTPDDSPKVAAIGAARRALGKGDRNQAMQAIRSALATPSVSAASLTPDTGATAPATPWTGPGPDPNVKPGTLGGISSTVGGAGGAGGNQRRPQASFSGPSADNAVPPNSLGGISNSTVGDGGTGAGTRTRPQANFGGDTGSVPPNSLGGISNSVAGDGGTGAGTRSRPQAGFSGPGPAQVIVPDGTQPSVPPAQ